MNLAISGRLGMSLGNWQALLNCLLFIIRDIVGTGVHRIRNACQYVPRRLFD